VRFYDRNQKTKAYGWRPADEILVRAQGGICVATSNVALQNRRMLVAFLRFLALVVGLLAYYTAFFMYEDEEGKWQNRIEKLWVAINDRERQLVTKASAFFSKVAAITTKVLRYQRHFRMISANL
jgi:hypothetical protein